MKKMVISLMLVLCVPFVCAEIIEFDRIISDTYEIVTVNLNGESLLVNGAGANIVNAKSGSYVEVQNTAPLEQYVGGLYLLNLDNSTMNYYGGETSAFSIYDSATATFSGGSINHIYSYQDSDLIKHITFICDVDSIDLTGNLLTGDWLDGSSFSVTLQDQDPTKYDSVYSNINFVPEPGTLILFGLGGVALRRKKR